MKELLLVRHGQSEHHINGMTGGWTDLPLTPLGREQAARAGAYLRDRFPTKAQELVASDLARAAQTAEIIGAALGLAVVSNQALREIYNGVATNLRQEDANRLSLPRSEPVLDWLPYPEAESWRVFQTRVNGFMTELDAGGAERVLIVSHGGTLVAIVNWWLRIHAEENLRDITYGFDPCSVTHLNSSDDGSRRIVRLNDTRHLEGMG